MTLYEKIFGKASEPKAEKVREESKSYSLDSIADAGINKVTEATGKVYSRVKSDIKDKYDTYKEEKRLDEYAKQKGRESLKFHRRAMLTEKGKKMAAAEVSVSVSRYKKQLEGTKNIQSPFFGDAQSQKQSKQEQPKMRQQVQPHNGIYNPLFSDPFGMQTQGNGNGKKKRSFAPWDL